MHRWLIWNVFFRVHEQAKRHATYRFLRDMEAADQFSATELDVLRRQKLGDLIEYAYAHVPYIKTRMDQAGVKPADIREPGDLLNTGTPQGVALSGRYPIISPAEFVARHL